MEIHSTLLPKSDWVPNNPLLPLVVYKSAVDATGDTAGRFETLFRDHGWTGIWRNGIFDYQHYHVNAHEVLGIARGHGSVQLGGTGGISYAVKAGDCLALPAGTGHCLVAASEDFLVVGAYPPGQRADIKRSSATEEELEAIRKLPLPPVDPVTGRAEPLLTQWRSPSADAPSCCGLMQLLKGGTSRQGAGVTGCLSGSQNAFTFVPGKTLLN